MTKDEACKKAAAFAQARTIERRERDCFLDPITFIFAEALRKYHHGAAKYGTFDPATDQRDFIREAEAEILDAINYLAMFLLKI